MFTRPHEQFIWLGVLLVVLACVFADESAATSHWSKAHGLWGKRSLFKESGYETPKRLISPPKADSTWGSRYVLSMPYAEWDKRSQWQLANGLWGR
ncbi:unnamed protein product [Strongylus vulgaris]|uniref:Uncharacterized protein n=1 Tax=Strongylus vulgaris TaxID=40348 RepID=A0A3P7LIQ3_STRVU|nr:unnamed protein product [Strongylus vulgaris]